MVFNKCMAALALTVPHVNVLKDVHGISGLLTLFTWVCGRLGTSGSCPALLPS